MNPDGLEWKTFRMKRPHEEISKYTYLPNQTNSRRAHFAISCVLNNTEFDHVSGLERNELLISVEKTKLHEGELVHLNR